MKTLKCPRCKKIALSPKTYEKVNIDYCETCQGVWLDAGEIKQIIDTKEEKFSNKLVQQALQKASHGVSEIEKQSVELCPKCQKHMNPQNFNFKSGVIVDVCPSGHGMWLDRDELAHIQAHMEHWSMKLPELKKEWHDTLKSIELKSSLAEKKFDKRFHGVLGPIGDLAYFIVKLIGK